MRKYGSCSSFDRQSLDHSGHSLFGVESVASDGDGSPIKDYLSACGRRRRCRPRLRARRSASRAGCTRARRRSRVALRARPSARLVAAGVARRGAVAALPPLVCAQSAERPPRIFAKEGDHRGGIGPRASSRLFGRVCRQGAAAAASRWCNLISGAQVGHPTRSVVPVYAGSPFAQADTRGGPAQAKANEKYASNAARPHNSAAERAQECPRLPRRSQRCVSSYCSRRRRRRRQRARTTPRAISWETLSRVPPSTPSTRRLNSSCAGRLPDVAGPEGRRRIDSLYDKGKDAAPAGAAAVGKTLMHGCPLILWEDARVGTACSPRPRRPRAGT